MQEAVKSQWSTRQLEWQINSFFYERLLSSKNKEQVAGEVQTLKLAKKPEDVIRDLYAHMQRSRLERVDAAKDILLRII